MHILLTTIAFLLLFTLFEVGELQKFKTAKTLDLSFTQVAIERYNELRIKLNHRAHFEFRNMCPANEAEELDDDEDTPYTHRLSRFLSIYPILPQEHVHPNNEKFSKTSLKLLSQLVETLYGHTTLFQEAHLHPAQLEEVLQQFFSNAKFLTERHLLKTKTDLANIEATNSTYQEFFYKIFKGNTPQKNGRGEQALRTDNYDSLLNYISISPYPPLMSVYLAPKPLLIALFQNTKAVNEIIDERKRIYKALINENEGRDALQFRQKLTEEFRIKCVKLLPTDVDPALIDFNISKTYPAN